MFGIKKKEKKSEAELKAERENRIVEVQKSLKLQIVGLNKKKDAALLKVVEAKKKGMQAQEKQARGLLKQALASCRRAESMLMTLELAVQSRDLAELNMNFLNSVGALSDDIIAAEKNTDSVKKVEEKYLKANYRMQKQKEDIDRMLSVGEYASVASMGEDEYSEFDDEIDEMVNDATFAEDALFGKQKF